MLKEFKEFALKGNIFDLAIGVIIGAAFGKIVSSLVDDIIMPLVGILVGGVDLSKLSIKIGNATLAYGAFLQTVLDFLIISLSIFMVIRFFAKFKRKEELAKEEEVEVLDKKEELLAEIRDLLQGERSRV
ncbi:large conductance mechanosensitive channel protein MscL [Bacillus badius]|uniref:Large-conductance mechanosensitive channel n=1 Tax=Bacillus badius TaxID=1455 RepID=A0ABR5AZ63_BACBA|nr:large conductance mechanosensitive channel protein MscL [Bacillus badius]KIL80031.1 Large-conductance mechanosensitive channel [Bacillus badius]MED4717936.1 large conductance mechanosensitive channel protein MscL [Bacillus badius]